MSQKILVTGASGFLGARIVRKLVEGGHHVKAMVRASSSRRMFAGLPSSQLEVVEGDVTVGHTVYRSLAGCDRLFHVAALTKFWDRNPSAIEEAAVVGTGETLEAARRRRIGDIVYTSSVATLGTTPDQVEMDETKELNLTDPDAYVRGKKKAEDIALEHAKETRLVVVQPASIFGPGDWKPTMSGQTILRFLKWNMPIFDFPTIGGGINVVDSDDVAQGHLLALEKGRSGERYILGGENLTYEQVFTILAEITGLPGPGAPIGKGLAMLAARLMELRARMGGPDPEASVGMTRDFVDAYSWVTSAKAEKELGYTHRPARRTLARSVAWYLENGYVTGDDASRIRVDLRAPALSGSVVRRPGRARLARGAALRRRRTILPSSGTLPLMRAVVPYALVPMVGLIVAGCGGGVRYDPNAAPASGGAEPQGFTVPSCTPDASSQHLDTNGDGKHDAVSVRAGGSEVCRMSDSNGDGKLDTSEHYDHGRLVQRAIDTDGDGHADKWVSYPDPKDPTCTVTDVDKDRDGNHDAAQRTHTCTGSVVAAFTPKPLRFTYALPAATK